MSVRKRFRPFTANTQRSIRLHNAPLLLVIAEIRWERNAKVEAGFADLVKLISAELGDRFPNSDRGETVIPNPKMRDGLESLEYRSWKTKSGSYELVLTIEGVSLSCYNYDTFEEFQELLSALLRIVTREIDVLEVSRVGMRYVNQIQQEAVLSDLGNCFAVELLGFATRDRKLPSNITVNTALNFASFDVHGYRLDVRSGLVAAGQVFDPFLDPPEKKSFILDLDAVAFPKPEEGLDKALTELGVLADISYDFFKSVVTENYAEHFAERNNDDNS